MFSAGKTAALCLVMAFSVGLAGSSWSAYGKEPKPKAFAAKAVCKQDGIVGVNVLLKCSGAGLSIVDFTQPRHGSSAVVFMGYLLSYMPEPGFVGSDSFKYVIQDIYGNQAKGTVTVKVVSKDYDKNIPPKAGPLKVTLLNSKFALLEPLKNVTDIDSETVSLIGVGAPKYGIAQKILNGSAILYMAPNEFRGKDSFTYTVSDQAVGGDVRGATAGTDTGNVTVNIGTTPKQEYNNFQFSMGVIQQPIVNENAKIDISAFFQQCQKDTSGPGSTGAALALAHAYVAAMYLSGFNDILDSTRASNDIIARVLMTLGPNYFLATAAQESAFASVIAKSGYYQLDYTPRDIAWDAANVGKHNFYSYFEFLLHADRDQVINRVDTTGFCTSSIIAGYYTALTLQGVDSVRLAAFGVNYCANDANNVSASITANLPASTPTGPKNTDTRDYYYASDTGLMGMIATFFNRGRWQTSLQDFVYNHVDGKLPFTSAFTYDKDDQSGAGYTGRYIYQIQTAYNVLAANGAADSTKIFQADVTLADIQKYIDSLSQLYPASVLQAGKDKATAKMSGITSMPFTSSLFYNMFSQVVIAMLDASQKQWQPFQLTLKLLGTPPDTLQKVMPQVKVYSGTYQSLTRDGQGNITSPVVDTVTYTSSLALYDGTGAQGIYYIELTASGQYTFVPVTPSGYSYSVPCYYDYQADITQAWVDGATLTPNVTASP